MNPNSIIGCTDTETVMLDFDNTTFKQVEYWASRAMKWFKLGGFLILKSSKDCYHVVFNRPVSWKENMHIMAWVYLHSRNEALKKWFVLQCIKESSTLRVSPKGGKPSPRIVFRHGKQDEQIECFLLFRKQIKRTIKEMDTKRKKRILVNPYLRAYSPYSLASGCLRCMQSKLHSGWNQS